MALAAVAAAVTLASDLGLGGFRLPSHTRQVNETWLDQFRSWVYAGGFGWQIGVGLATYVTTSAVYLMLALAALTASPLTALAIVTGFGLVRGLAILLGVGLTTPARMMALHRRLDELLPAAQRAIVATQAIVLAVAVGAVWGPVPAAVLAAAGVAAVVARRPRPAVRPGTHPHRLGLTAGPDGGRPQAPRPEAGGRPDAQRAPRQLGRSSGGLVGRGAGPATCRRRGAASGCASASSCASSCACACGAS